MRRDGAWSERAGRMHFGFRWARLEVDSPERLWKVATKAAPGAFTISRPHNRSCGLWPPPARLPPLHPLAGMRLSLAQQHIAYIPSLSLYSGNF